MGKKAARTILYLGLIALAISCFLLYSNNAIKISRFTVNIKELPGDCAGLRIVHISDLHGKTFGRQNRRLAGAINRLEPDLILVSGDMIDSHSDDGSAFIDLLGTLAGRYPVYCSLGNHEQIVQGMTASDRYGHFVKRLRDSGAILLDNERAEIDKNGATFGIYGLTAMLYHYSSEEMAEIWEGAGLKATFIEDQLGPPQDGEVTILLAHNPKYFQEYVRWGPDLICAGHIHGGVIRLPLLGGLLSPDLTFFPPYSAGLYYSGETTMHVSRGLGNSVIPFRILNRPDLSLIELKPLEIPESGR
jgi:predicted MPP superfamily phosphohydrolase